MAEFLTSTDGATFDDRTRRFELVEFEGWSYTDNTQILGPRRRARSRGAYRTPNKIDGSVEFTAAKTDANSDYINAVRRQDQSLIGIVYNEAGSYRDWLAGEWRFEDVPQTMGDQLTTSLTGMAGTPMTEPLIFTPGADAYIPNSGITSGTAIALGSTVDFGVQGNPVFVVDISANANLGGSPALVCELSVAGATGTPWSLTARTAPRADGGVYIFSFNPAPQDFDVHPNVTHATAAVAAQVAAASAGATTVELTFTNFSGTRTDYEADLYVGRRMQRN